MIFDCHCLESRYAQLPAGSQYPEQPSNKRQEGEQLLEKRNILALGETSCDIRSRCQNSRRSSGELATVTTYSPGRIRFYSVAKSSNLCGAATLPRVCEPAGSRYAAEKERATAKFRELLRLLLIPTSMTMPPTSLFTAEGHDSLEQRCSSSSFFPRVLCSRNLLSVTESIQFIMHD